MKLETVAEYVQSQGVLDVVRELGVDWAQGFHVGEPVRLKELFGEGTITDMAELVDVETALIRQLPSDA